MAESIQDEITLLREKRYFEELKRIKNKLEKIVQDEMDTSLFVFLTEYIEMDKKIGSGTGL